MSINPTTRGSSPLSAELTDGCSTSSISLSVDSIFNIIDNKRKEHLDNERVQQHMLDRWLITGLQMVQRKDQEMAQVAPTLQLLLQHGAQCRSDTLLEHQTTPYHLICKSTGDHHELLDWMIKISGRAQIDSMDDQNVTALLYAVEQTNSNCVRSLITNGADVNKVVKRRPLFGPLHRSCTPFRLALDMLLHNSTKSPIVMTEVFDLLVESGADVNLVSDSRYQASPIRAAICARNVDCVVKMIKNGAKMNGTDPDNFTPVWVHAATMGSVEIVKCLLEHGIDKDCTDPDYGFSLLLWVVCGHNVEAVRYLLDLGVTIPKFTTGSDFRFCQCCGANRLFLVNTPVEQDPCLRAVNLNQPKIVELLDEYGSSSLKCFEALRNAVRSASLGSVEYLLSKYTYSINVDYLPSFLAPGARSTCRTLLTETCNQNKVKITKLLLDHGADPNKKICNGKGYNALTFAIWHNHEEVIALYIRNGVNINSRSCHSDYGKVLPFEASILYGRLYVAEMFLLVGCSCGVYSLRNTDMTDIKSDLKDLMEEWNVQHNFVVSLKQQCRRMILNYLSPQADKKIMKLSLPPNLTRYLHIPELDNILDV